MRTAAFAALPPSGRPRRRAWARLRRIWRRIRVGGTSRGLARRSSSTGIWIASRLAGENTRAHLRPALDHEHGPPPAPEPLVVRVDLDQHRISPPPAASRARPRPPQRAPFPRFRCQAPSLGDQRKPRPFSSRRISSEGFPGKNSCRRLSSTFSSTLTPATVFSTSSRSPSSTWRWASARRSTWASPGLVPLQVRQVVRELPGRVPRLTAGKRPRDPVRFLHRLLAGAELGDLLAELVGRVRVVARDPAGPDALGAGLELAGALARRERGVVAAIDPLEVPAVPALAMVTDEGSAGRRGYAS
jgi:hypothetical protein